MPLLDKFRRKMKINEMFLLSSRNMIPIKTSRLGILLDIFWSMLDEFFNETDGRKEWGFENVEYGFIRGS